MTIAHCGHGMICQMQNVFHYKSPLSWKRGSLRFILVYHTPFGDTFFIRKFVIIS